MKKSVIWVAACLLAGTAAYILSKRKKIITGNADFDDSNKGRHRTTVFSAMKNNG